MGDGLNLQLDFAAKIGKSSLKSCGPLFSSNRRRVLSHKEMCFNGEYIFCMLVDVWCNFSGEIFNFPNRWIP